MRNDRSARSICEGECLPHQNGVRIPGTVIPIPAEARRVLGTSALSCGASPPSTPVRLVEALSQGCSNKVRRQAASLLTLSNGAGASPACLPGCARSGFGSPGSSSPSAGQRDRSRRGRSALKRTAASFPRLPQEASQLLVGGVNRNRDDDAPGHQRQKRAQDHQGCGAHQQDDKTNVDGNFHSPASLIRSFRQFIRGHG